MLKFQKNSIKIKITVFVLAAMTVIFSLSGGYLYWDHYKMAIQENQEKAVAVAKLLAGISSYTFLTADYTILDEAIQKAMEQDELLYVRIFDKEDNIKRENKKENISKHFIEVKEPIIVAQEPAGYILLGLSTKETYARIQKGIGITVIQVIIGLIVSSAVLILILNKLVISPIAALNIAATKISEGNLKETLSISGDDEIASLSRAINTMAINLKDMIFKIRGITNTITNVTSSIAGSSQRVLNGANIQKRAVNETSHAIVDMNEAISSVIGSEEVLANLSEETSSSIMEMNSSIELVADNSSVFYEASQETASSVEEMIASIKQIAENLENLSAFSEETSSAITEMSASVREVQKSAIESVKLAEQVNRDVNEEGMTAIQSALKGIDNIRESVKGLSEVINRLRKKSENIGKIVTVIDTITDQTTLLAINAAILASKAGEHGRGFSVVANEIKDLAERTSISTSEISKLISSVQEETKSSVEMSEKGIHSVEKGSVLFGSVTAALNRIIESSNTSTDMAKVIQRATEQEVQVINQITNSIKSMVEQINQIAAATAEQRKGSKFIIEATEKMKNVSLQVKTTTKEQSHGSRQITSAIENVTYKIELIKEATGNQKNRSSEIIKAVDRIYEITEDLIQSSGAMDAEINTLTLEAQNLISALQKFKV